MKTASPCLAGPLDTKAHIWDLRASRRNSNGSHLGKAYKENEVPGSITCPGRRRTARVTYACLIDIGTRIKR